MFKYTNIELRYEDGESLIIIADYKSVIDGLLRHGKDDLVKGIFKSMNEHFIKLRASEIEEFREFYPRKTAGEMFLDNEDECQN